MALQLVRRACRCCTTRNRLATNAASVSAAFAAGLAPVPWKSENAADWLTNTPPVRLIDSATPASSATSIASLDRPSSSVEYSDSVSAPWLLHRVARDREALRRCRFGRDDERDRAEPFVQVLVAIGGVELARSAACGSSRRGTRDARSPASRARSCRARAPPRAAAARRRSARRPASRRRAPDRRAACCTPSAIAAATWSND